MLTLHVFVVTSLAALAVFDLYAAIRRPDRRAWRQCWFTLVVNAVFVAVLTALFSEWL
jgi:hypothetical protein